MEKHTSRSYHAGEEIDAGQPLLLPWSGDGIDAHNVLRRHILKYHTPQYDGKPVVLPVSHLGWGRYEDLDKPSSSRSNHAGENWL